MAEAREIYDPATQRTWRLKPGDKVIMQYTGGILTPEQVAELEAIVKRKFGDEFPVLIVSQDFNISVYRPEPERAMMIA